MLRIRSLEEIIMPCVRTFRYLPLVILLSPFLLVAGVDFTVVSEAYGKALVDAVIDRIRDKCIFPNDRLFLRRVASVVSNDGAAPDTFRPGFHGGIWQVPEAKFLQTLNCNDSAIVHVCNNVNQYLGIYWPSVTWTNLSIPIYSGVAASLVTLLTLNQAQMPGNVTGQAAVFQRIYVDLPNNTFNESATNADSVECDGREVDLVFVLDSSGSIGRSDFNLMLNFSAEVVQEMEISPQAARVATVVYSTNSRLEFGLDTYTTKQDIKNALLKAYKDGGGTSTYLGLDLARETLGQSSRTTKVAVVVTDGQSSSFARTKAAAKRLKDSLVTVFAIGVGNYKLDELVEIASHPTCSHLFTLTSFDHIRSILVQIQRSVCRARDRINGDKPMIREEIPEEGEKVTAETKVPDKNHTVEAEVQCGILDIFVSMTDTQPSAAVFDERYQALPDSPALIRTTAEDSEGSPLYIFIIANRLPEAAEKLLNCFNASWILQVAPTKSINVMCEAEGGQRPCESGEVQCSSPASHVCQEDGGSRPCTYSDFVRLALCKPKDSSDLPFDKPCSNNDDPSVWKFPFPYDPSKYVQCDKSGGYKVKDCPDGVIFNEETWECGFTDPETTTEATSGAREKSAVGLASTIAMCQLAIWTKIAFI